MKEKYTLQELFQWNKRQEELKIKRRNTADHRHKWKDGKRVRIFGSTFHVYCVVKGCEEFKVL